MRVELLHLDGFMQCFMSAVNCYFSDWDVLVQAFFSDSYPCNPEPDSFDTWTVVRYWSQLLNF